MRNAAEPTLPARDAQIKVLAGVVDYVEIPKESRFVADAMEPVVNKIVDKKQSYPGPPRVGRKLERRDAVKKQIDEAGSESKNYAKSNAAESECYICRCVDRFIEFVRAQPARKMSFERDQCSE